VEWWACTGLICLKIGTGGGLLWVIEWTPRFHEVHTVSVLSEEPLASQKWLCCMKLVIIPGFTACDTQKLLYQNKCGWKNYNLFWSSDCYAFCNYCVCFSYKPVWLLCHPKEFVECQPTPLWSVCIMELEYLVLVPFNGNLWTFKQEGINFHFYFVLNGCFLQFSSTVLFCLHYFTVEHSELSILSHFILINVYFIHPGSWKAHHKISELPLVVLIVAFSDNEFIWPIEISERHALFILMIKMIKR
jgi:hypothetical protein